MQGPSSSTTSDSAVCTGLWEAGVGCVRVYLFLEGGVAAGLATSVGCSGGEGKGDNTQQIS